MNSAKSVNYGLQQKGKERKRLRFHCDDGDESDEGREKEGKRRQERKHHRPRERQKRTRR